MQFKLTFEFNKELFLKNPDESSLGKKIVKNSIELIHEIGFESFTFKKLATKIGTTEASVYRYFENKHKLLLYIISWYWFFIEFYIDFHLQNMAETSDKLKVIIHLLTNDFPYSQGEDEYDINLLHQIIVSESSKVYLVKDVDEINKSKLFKPYKDLCHKIAEIIALHNPAYPYPVSLSSTLIEVSHQQTFFLAHLPSLTDIEKHDKEKYTYHYLENLLFSAVGYKD